MDELGYTRFRLFLQLLEMIIALSILAFVSLFIMREITTKVGGRTVKAINLALLVGCLISLGYGLYQYAQGDIEGGKLWGFIGSAGFVGYFIAY